MRLLAALRGPGSFLLPHPASPSPPGLAELAARKYKQAAKCFLLAAFDHCDFPEVRAKQRLALRGRRGLSHGTLGGLLPVGGGRV